MVNIPRGISIGATVRKKKAMVPARHLINKRHLFSFGLKKLSLKTIFTIIAYTTKLNAERKKENSKTVTPRLVTRSFVNIVMIENRKATILVSKNTYFIEISVDFFI